MEIKKGIGVSPGVVISTAVVLDAEDLLIPERHVPPEKVGHEIEPERMPLSPTRMAQSFSMPRGWAAQAAAIWANLLMDCMTVASPSR